mmetsp:Transcript_6035/g.10939  ORF Transcript_6035/g.10939 Transcript_6035/m.10939 type:complete len:223 (+) Transcript_6035:2451-3119(+)
MRIAMLAISPRVTAPRSMRYVMSDSFWGILKGSYSIVLGLERYSGLCGHFLAASAKKRSIFTCIKLPSTSCVIESRREFTTSVASFCASFVESNSVNSIIPGLEHSTQLMLRFSRDIEAAISAMVAVISESLRRIPLESKRGAGIMAAQQLKSKMSLSGNPRSLDFAIFNMAARTTLAVSRSRLMSNSFLISVSSSPAIAKRNFVESRRGLSSNPIVAVLFK